MVSMAQLKPARQEGASHTATGGRTDQRARTAHVKVLGWELRGQGGWRALRQGAPVGDVVRGDPADAQGQAKALRDECNIFRGLRRPVGLI